ncbi:threonine--tRNA ligase [Propionicimonas sp.]|uniref:threonine--tRNA ligase n=1 Tax=Propionicimonas sp. TaxID=1955623 RepID=UPI0017A4DFCA|nr:threonine--tRNA ligase [Propionicimonas sp.]MBU3975905.1 threonine--tRNA ligase [Actinomycetota bacterium]MBA3019696.1 threonine--tRNA ligase [Propionicimonas sp.]MBU3987586.1 threonine--tRNA ligase [Actinomycetota bacterium]MBU4006453.1 threonine--tRNA ligase [Actinomycetota bacterium]MBU4066659.1 threonine--tRNA ligase [Actinomycetota bacterium]
MNDPGAEALDHRDLNHDLDVFATEPLAGSGLPLWLSAGAAIRNELQRLAKDIAHADGCVDVYTPVLGKRALFERSGHWTKFAADMFPPMKLGEDEVVLRPANCPHHALVYASRQHSYRELPIRLNELGAMFRAERSGVVSGLQRVRQINLDDTHVFCRADQVAGEVARALRSALRAQRILGLPVDYVRLSLRGDSGAWLGSIEQWQASQQVLREAAEPVLAGEGLALVDGVGEAAFYGPKLDLQVRDRRGHEETIATVQLDFNQPENFDLTYQAADGSRQRVVMIHRGTVGAMERVVAALLERYQGRLPFWLAPVQVVVLPVGEAQDEAARAAVDGLRAAGLRAEIDHDGSLGARIRDARRRRVSLVAVIGEREAADGLIQVTDGSDGSRRSLALEELMAKAGFAYAHREPIAW